MTSTRPGQSLDAAIASRDVHALLRAIDELQQSTPPRHRPAAWLFADGLALLLVRASFEQFLAAVESPLTESWSVFRVLNSRARRLTGEQLARVVALVGAPQQNIPRTALLSQTIINHPDPAITHALISFIRAHADNASIDVDSFHLRPAARIWRGNGNALAIADTVAALGRRRDPHIPDALISLLHEIPWGDDAYTTAALLESLLQHPDEQCRLAITDSMFRHRSPGQLRLALLAAEHTFSPHTALPRLLYDLRIPLASETHFDYLLLLNTWLADAASPLAPPIVESLKQLTPQDWPPLLRIKYALILRRHAPRHTALARLTFADQFLALAIASFERLRMDSRGHAWRIPLLLASTILISALLNIIIDLPPAFMRGVNPTLVLLWLLTLIITARTHVTMEERNKSKLWKAILFWLLTLLMLTSIIGTRLYARFHGP